MKTRIVKDVDGLTAVALLLLVVGITVSFSGHLQSHGTININELVDSFYANIGTELISIAITVLVIDKLAIQRQENQNELHLKAGLIARAGSRIRETSVAAIDELARHGWLYDGTLAEANLQGANLKGTVLHATYQGGANFKDAHLQKADLSDMRLYEVNLEQADLQRTKLSRAQLVNANLKGANLDYANLEGAYLFLTDLEGAHLYHTNLKDAKLWNANLLGAKNLTDLQLASASRLRDATMQNGRRYDGRFNLAGDIQDAEDDGIDVNEEKSMAAWYGIALADYFQGQEWAKKHLSGLSEGRT